MKAITYNGQCLTEEESKVWEGSGFRNSNGDYFVYSKTSTNEYLSLSEEDKNKVKFVN